jgi:hypothetical protein
MQNKVILAHYMPWFTDGQAKQPPPWHHWCGDQNLAAVDTSHQIASHYYPRDGLYDSANVEAIARHVQLMQEAGIDGVIVDWKGIGTSPNGDIRDFAELHNAVLAIWTYIKSMPKPSTPKRPFQFAVCLDGDSLKVVHEETKLGSDPHKYALEALKFAQQSVEKVA